MTPDPQQAAIDLTTADLAWHPAVLCLAAAGVNELEAEHAVGVLISAGWSLRPPRPPRGSSPEPGGPVIDLTALDDGDPGW